MSFLPARLSGQLEMVTERQIMHLIGAQPVSESYDVF